MSNDAAAAIIARLSLEPHPEGGWYRETWREGPGRGHATAIYFLLEAGQRSHWHRVDAAELWLFHAGSPLVLGIARDDAGPVEWVRLGTALLDGHEPQRLVPAGWWQAAEAQDGWALVSCVVAPGFEFGAFELASEGWEPGTR